MRKETKSARCLAILVGTGLLLTTGIAVTGCAPSEDEADEAVENAGQQLTGEVSIFTSSDTPAVLADPDTSAVELGLRFRSDVAGTVTGVRFYKASANRGTHVGHLWSNTGALLGTVTFAGETSSGWQTARFATPVPIQANTTYVVSYFAPRGRYSATNNAFANAGLDRPPLHVLRDGQDGRNGVYKYGSQSFPTNTWKASNYFVDVLFKAAGGTETPPPPTTTSPPPPPPPPSATCDLTATPSNLAAQFSAAQGGQTICLASGNYSFSGGSKTGRVTLRPASGASVKMDVNLRNARNITFDGMAMGSFEMTGSRDITVSRVAFSGQAILNVGEIADANILFDGDSFVDTPACTSCHAGRITVIGRGSASSGVVIRNCLFDGGPMDGVRPDAVGVVIEDSEFRNFVNIEPYHTDPIQIYGGRRVTIRRNFFHHNEVPAHIGGWDGNDHNIIEDNVFVGSSDNGLAIAMMSDNGSIIRHNTMVQGQCAWNWKCGVVRLDSKTGMPPSTGTIFQDNIVSTINSNGAGAITLTPNLFTGSQTPIYVGPPTTRLGYKLAAGSPGKGGASDGLDFGIR